jgi:hypothetical protein
MSVAAVSRAHAATTATATTTAITAGFTSDSTILTLDS